MGRTIAEADTDRPAPAQTTPGAPAAPQLDPAIAILRQYYPQLKRLLPSHVLPDAWYSSVYAALYRGRDDTKKIDLWRAANRNPESLMFALFDAARLGHEPGTEQYYLTPRPNRNAPGGLEVLGMEGYQGVIDRMYRAGAQSVRVHEVRERDEYRYDEDVDPVPYHRHKKFARAAERGEIIGAYAYAVLPGGSTSQVVEITLDDIERAKESSGTAKYTDKATFWNHWHDKVAMVRKTAAHQLEKWVPTSTEFRFAIAQAGATAQAIGAAAGQRALAGTQGPNLAEAIAGAQERTALPAGGAPDDVPEAPIDVTQFSQPPAPEDEAPAEVPTPPPAKPAPKDLPTTFPAVAGTGAEPPAAAGQQRAMTALLTKAGVADEQTRLALMARLAGRTSTIAEPAALTNAEGRQVITLLGDWQDGGVLQVHVDAVRAALPAAAPADSAKLPKPGTKAWHDQKHPVIQDGAVAQSDVVLDGNCGICEQPEDGR